MPPHKLVCKVCRCVFERHTYYVENYSVDVCSFECRKNFTRTREYLFAKFWANVQKETKTTSQYVDTPCYLWMGNKDQDGYGRLSIGGRKLRVHRIALELEGHVLSADLHVCHLCHNKSCVRAEHLHQGTPAENIAESVSAGRHIKWERAARSKLTREDVLDIRRRLLAGETRRALAEEYGVCYSNIEAIDKRLTWRGVEPL